MLIVRGVNVFPSQIEEIILDCDGLAPHYAIELSRPNRLDEISISVEARPNVDAKTHVTKATLLATRLKDRIGISAEVRVVMTGSLPRSAGKATHVIDRRLGQ